MGGGGSRNRPGSVLQSRPSQVVPPWCLLFSVQRLQAGWLGFASCWYFPQTTPVWISCWRGSWQNRSCCAESLLSLRKQGGKEARFRAQTLGAGSLQYALALSS